MPSRLPLTHEIVIQAEDGSDGTARVPCTAPVLLGSPLGQRRFVMIDDGVGKNKLALGRVVDVETGVRIWAPSEVEYFPFPQYDLATLVRCRISGRDVKAWECRIEMARRAIAEHGLKDLGIVGETPEMAPAPVPAKAPRLALAARPEEIARKREEALGGLFG